MAGFSTYLSNKVLDEVFGGVAFAAPGSIYVGAFTSAPTDAGGGTEATGGSYARVAVTNNATNFPAASGGAKANGTAIQFPQASASWGTITHIALFDASSGGNQLGWGALAVSKVIDTLDTFVLAIGDLDITLD